jgi:hypothetical protein
MSNRRRGGRGGARPANSGHPAGQFIVRGQELDLGELGGEAQAPVIATFRYFGESFTVNPNVSEVDLIDFMDDASAVSVDDPNAITIVKKFARRIVATDEFDAFWTSVREHRQDSERLMGTLWAILEGVTARPTSPPSGSSDGRPGTNPSSPPDVSPPDSAQFPDQPGDRRIVRDGPDVLAAQEGGDPLRAKYLEHIARLEAQGPMGVALASQVAMAAEGRGVNVTREWALQSA